MVGKKAKVETPKSLQKSGKKGVKEPKTSAVEESFAGFEEDEINLNSEGRINLNNVIDKLGGDKVASTSQAVVDETPAEEAEDKQTAEEEDQEMTVDTAAAVSDDTDSDQMEIDSRASDKGDKNKEAEDVDIMDTDSVKSDNAKTDSAVEKGATAKIEYCGACSAQVDDAEEGICCDGACERWFHLKCSGLSNAEYYQLSSDENAAWACSKCSGKPPPILPADSKTPKISVRKDLQKTPGPSVAKRKSVAREGATPRTPKIDISNPAYLKPFDFGWKRELVYRTSNENASGKRNGDVYYYAPQGKKLRSLREISEHVSGTELTADNFTFFKEPLGIDDPEKEIIRDAKYKLAKDGTASPSIVAKKAAAATPKISKAPPKTTPKLTATVKSAVDTNGTTDTPKAHGSVAARGVLKGKNTPMPTLKVKIAPLKTVTPRPIISKGGKDHTNYGTMAEKTIDNSTRRSSTSRGFDFDSFESSEKVAIETGYKRNTYRRYGLLANRRTSSPGSDSLSDTEPVPTEPPPKKRRGRAKGRKSRKQQKPKSKEIQTPLVVRESPSNGILIENPNLASPPWPHRNKRALPPLMGQKTPIGVFVESSNLASRLCPPEIDQAVPAVVGLNRTSFPPVQFRPSNPSSYGCLKSPSGMLPTLNNLAHSSKTPSHTIHKDSNEGVEDSQDTLGKESQGNFEFVSVSPDLPYKILHTSPLSVPQSSTSQLPAVKVITIGTPPLPSPSQPSPTNSLHIVDVITLESDDDEEEEDDSKFAVGRCTSTSRPAVHNFNPYLHSEVDSPAYSMSKTARRYAQRRQLKAKRWLKKQKEWKIKKSLESSRIKRKWEEQRLEKARLNRHMCQLEAEELGGLNKNTVIVIDD